MGKAKIVIVEDEGVVALQIKSYLQKKGYDVPATFASGDELIRSIDELNPDLVMMDITLQGELNGTETARLLNERHDIPVVYLTAHSDENTIAQAGMTFPYGYILKPFDPDELYITIHIALMKHKSDKEKNELTEQLQKALAEVKVLSGLIPICSYCKSIRNDKNYWETLESYITKHSDALFSHGICPACMKKEFPPKFNILKRE